MRKLWGRLNSINVQKVVWCLAALGLDHERVDAGGAFGVVGTPEFGRLNPNRLVPVLEEDGLVLWESNAIVRYLAARYGAGTLWPEDPGRRALCDRWMDWQATQFTPIFGPAFMGLVRTEPARRDMAAISQSVAKGEECAAILDAHLAAARFVGGDGFTMGDICVGCAAHRWLNLPCERRPRPHLERWYAAIRDRPAAASVLTLPLS